MFRDRPLICLFIAATFVVDGVLFVTFDSQTPSLFTLGIILGQLAAMAIWMVRGQTHRLTRAAGLLLTICGQLFLFRKLELSEILTFFFFCVLMIVVSTGVSDFVKRKIRSRAEVEEIKTKWQISLVECFGWTIVVSIISYGARFMDFGEFFRDGRASLMSTVFSTVPVFVALFSRCDLKGVHLGGALGILCVAIVEAFFLSKYILVDLKYLILGQTLYLLMWLIVLGMNKVLLVADENQSLGKEASSAEVPESFDLEA